MPSDMPTDGPTFETPIFTEYDADDQTPVCPPDCEDPDASAGPLCGNGIVEDGEQCDDGNARPGDGCSGVCRLEANYACPVPGMDCVSTIVCGDGKISGGEACDDGNTTNGDGCSALCEVESGYACTQPGMLCTPVTMNMGYCGDGMVNAGETCDDGNTVGNDGCSATCQHESGWTCAMPGAMCVRDEYCGDGKLNGDEECDDGNLLPGDGCTGTCKQEPFFTCPVPGMACASTIVCGDGLVVGDEACDDGNTMGGDGCAADCKQVEAGYTCPTAFGVGGVCTAVPMDICGDGRLSYGEFCDDGNMVGGDGCSGDCKVEAGYTCGDPGTACTLVGWCGDGKLSLADGEQCDDDNDVGGDGCSSQCLIEANYVCPEPGTLCTSTVVCGDGRITGSEQCDDGNAVGADGCSATCQIETGWTCLSPGRACRATFCGDGIKVGAEQCDDGNTNNADGCSADCKLETPADNERDGWICNTPGMSCTRTTCGNGMREGSEQCDDGNNNTGDGCTPFCRREPICPTAGGACSTACGDGLLLASDIAAGQECDDGNTVSGDGCSSTCKIEQGYECTTITIHPNPLILPIVYRDFKGLGLEGSNEHPDFQNAVIQTAKPLGEPGVVKPILGANGKPVHIDGQTESTVNNQPGYDSQNWFSYWFQDTSGITQTVLETLTFTRLMTGEYQFNSGSGFFPLNERGWGNYVNSGINCTVETPRNFHFTSELRYWFEYQGNERLDFVGDDDLWVFINKRLTIDLGGLHPVNTGNVILHANNGTGAVCDFLTQEPVWPPPSTCTSYRTVDLGLELGKVYEIVVFHAERYTCGSNYHLTLANFSGQRSQCGPVCGDGFVTPDEACDLGAVHNTGAYGTCNADCSLPARCGDGMVDASNGEACDNGINSATYGGNAQLCGPECQIAPYCGDGMVDSANGEACDDGIDNGRGYGFCSATCQLGPRCGDGTVSDGEECDDGVVLNGTSGSLCMSNCLLKCGNGVMDPGEACDDGKVNNVGGYGKCSPLCQLGPRCGDGIKNGNEECDDGKNDGTYGTCAPGCVFGPRCGDAVVQTPAGEQCDAGNANQADPYGEEMCNTRCQWAPYCGDKAVDVSKGEQCDDGVNDGTPGSCTTDCSGAVPLPSCGDNTRQDPEQCDDGANNGTAGSTCDIHCRWKCGNGFKDPGEACDDGVNNGSYGTCNANCTLAPHCGDGVKNGPEQCDLGTGNETNPYGSSKCSSLCTTAPYCGDGRIQSAFGEECEPPSVGCGSMCKFQAID